MLFLTGSRDTMAQQELLEPLCQGLGTRVDLHLFDSADHGFKTLKRSGLTSEQVWRQAGDAVAALSLRSNDNRFCNCVVRVLGGRRPTGGR